MSKSEAPERKPASNEPPSSRAPSNSSNPAEPSNVDAGNDDPETSDEESASDAPASADFDDSEKTPAVAIAKRAASVSAELDDISDDWGDDGEADAPATESKTSGLDVFNDLVKKPGPAALSRPSSAPPPPPPPSKAMRPPASIPRPAPKPTRPPSTLPPPNPAAARTSTPVPVPPPNPRATRIPTPIPLPGDARAARAPTPAPLPPPKATRSPAPLSEGSLADDPQRSERLSSPPDLDSDGKNERASSRPPRPPSYPAGHKNVLAALGKRDDSTPARALETTPARRRSSPPVRRRSAPNLPVLAPTPLPMAPSSGSSFDDASEPVLSRPASIPPPPQPAERNPSIPPPPRPRGVHDTSRPSETPPGVSLTSSPSASPLAGGRGLRFGLVAAAIVVLGGGVGLALRPTSGTLVVSASGPHGRVVPSVEIYVDSEKRCNTSPCRVEDLSEGVHIVEAKAPGHVPMAGKAVKIQSGDEVPFDLELQRADPTTDPKHAVASNRDETQRRAAPGTKTNEDAEAEQAPTTSIDELEPDDGKAPAAGGPVGRPAGNQLAKKLAGVEPSAAQPAAASQPEATQATLNLNSIPAANVVVDGRPLGLTPRLGLSVAPGAHTVVFIHPEHGRKVQQVSVQAGQTQTAAVRFP